jgi:tRNA A-37 threonylcarbamoyl transferase component Bud32
MAETDSTELAGELRPGRCIGGRYFLVRRLGLGGMGEVWLAELHGEGAFRRRVVIKVLAPDRRGDDQIARMLADEARVVGLLHHPGIVTATDYLETDSEGPVFVLEYVDGTSLRTALRLARHSNDLMPEAVASHVGSQVARALHAAHTARDLEGRPLRVVHRDVSPDNVLLSRSGAVYLGDFGVARAAGSSEVTAPGAAPKGKIGYMAPEQAARQPLGPPADVFSLGRVIAEAADVNCGAALRTVLDKATAEDARHRYQTAAEFAAALIAACPPPHDADGALAGWLMRAAAEALGIRQTSHGTSPGEPPPVEVPQARRAEAPPLFAAVPPPRSRWVRGAAWTGVVLALLLPVALIVAEAEHRGLIHLHRPGIHAPTGELRVHSQPASAEVYVDGTLRGQTPIQLELPVGHHAVRVGSPRLEKWRAADVEVREDVVHALEVDLTE